MSIWLADRMLIGVSICSSSRCAFEGTYEKHPATLPILSCGGVGFQMLFTILCMCLLNDTTDACVGALLHTNALARGKQGSRGPNEVCCRSKALNGLACC